ncbi:hypothetical protein PSQ19_09655 [Devosia algicola]|uniref:Outer membrane protein beta-barrel domain-containing protein n=1 Tax=Devosia algicola TaxID=3026418 RepID=A0ABY7YIY7_9HYPH|nr:hypothetical protein [Devosia algicola]WDR01157.1 hypothetical protein PSQ19_09655 [Devosia algicola]
MRKLIAAMLVAGAANIALPVIAADLPVYSPIIDIPDVDYGVQGSFYLRGSAAANALWSKEVKADECGCGDVTYPVNDWGYGYSVGAGFGYETGTGLRFDATVDYLANDGVSITKTAPGVAGKYSLKLRSTIALANAYYDFSFGNSGMGSGYSAAGGAFGYVGAGIGAAFNQVSVDAPAGNPITGGSNTSLAAAGMVGIGYDFGAFTADVGYRAIYMAKIANTQPAPMGFSTSNNWIHEVRSTLRYRIN